MKSNIKHYYEILNHIYSLDEHEIFTINQLRKIVTCSDGKLRTILLHLIIAHFIFPLGNKGYCLNSIKGGFGKTYDFTYHKDYIRFSNDTFEMIFKSTNFYYTVDQKGIDVERLKIELTYLLSFMLIYIKDYKVWCNADIYQNQNGMIFKRKYFLVYSEIQIFTCSIKTDSKHLIFGIA